MTSSAKQSIQESKEEFENQIFDLATPLLQKLYNKFVKIPEQLDKPDAAIELLNPPKRFGTKEKVTIGIEITSVDPGWYLAYANDGKYGADLVMERLEQTLKQGIIHDNPTKNTDVPIPHSFIFDGIKGKAGKHEAYKAQGKFDEIILLCFSEVIWARNPIFQGGLAAWTDYQLSEIAFPYDKVIFLGLTDQRPVQIYDRKNKKTQRPSPYLYPDATITCSKPATMPCGTIENIDSKFFGAPIIPPRPRKPE